MDLIKFFFIFFKHTIFKCQKYTLGLNSITKSYKQLNNYYYIDRCDLWGFICEINSGISHVRYQFFPAGTTFTQL